MPRKANSAGAREFVSGFQCDNKSPIVSEYREGERE